MTDSPIPGEVRMIDGKRFRFIERELEGDKWEVIDGLPPLDPNRFGTYVAAPITVRSCSMPASPIPAAPSDVAGVVAELLTLSALEPGWYANVGKKTGERCCAAMSKAATLIQSLSLDREVMREALEPFAKASAAVRYKRENDVLYGVTSSEPGRSFRLTWGDAHNARAALASVKGGA